MDKNYIILAAISELCAARTEVPRMREILLRLAKSYRDVSKVAALQGREPTIGTREPA